MAITQIQNDTFRDAIIDMDSKRFFSCVFTNCRLRYAGGQCEWDKNTIFTRCTWEFVDSALRSKQIFDLILSVPKILTLFIPEILSHPAIAGRAKTLSVPPVGEPAGRREEDVRNVKASRSRNSAEGRSLQGRSGPSSGSVPVLC